MSEQQTLVNHVVSYTTATPGRCLNNARNHHFVIDEPPHAGGSGEEITPAEAFLAAVSACGILLVEGYARRDGIRLASAHAEIDGVRSQADKSWFQNIALQFRLAGPTPEEARTLVAEYQQNCPLYRTVAAATKVTVSIEAVLEPSRP
ncbi:MAG TPA: OsmC family protein [Candidatus Acidoferrales bacterium]|nr:OsmC family protein [Candidatus Acidoferrales bacterium]